MNDFIYLLGQRLGDWSRQLPHPPVDPPLQQVFMMPLVAGGGVPELSLSPFLICPQVYGASNVELITRTRTEHLSEQHKGKVKGNEAGVDGGRCEGAAPTPVLPSMFPATSQQKPG